MKKIFGFFCLTLFVFAVNASQIVKIEYFFDSDPGFGKGYSITLNEVDSIVEVSRIIPIPESLDAGIHSLYIRTVDINGKWSQTYFRQFFYIKDKPSKLEINKLEYYINDDPGLGKGIEIPISKSDATISQSYTIPIPAELPKGLNTFYIRAKNNFGQWSQLSKRLFYNTQIDASNNFISKLEYAFDTDPGIGKGLTSTIPPSLKGEKLDLSIDITSLSTGIHTLFLRTKNTIGQWSQTSKRLFIINETEKGDSICKLEYYFKSNDTTSRLFTYSNFSPKPAIEISDLALLKDSLNLKNDKDYEINIRFVTTKGIRSNFYKKYFTFYDSIPTGKIPLNKWIPINNLYYTYTSSFALPDTGKWFFFVKKNKSFNADLQILKNGEEIVKETNYSDIGIQLPSNLKGLFNISLRTINTGTDGFLKIASAPDTIYLNNWHKGTVFHSSGYDWKCIDILTEIDTLFIQTEGFGLWSTLEIFYMDVNNPSEKWYFGTGFQIKGKIINPKKGRYYLRYKDSASLSGSTQEREYLIFVGGEPSPNTGQKDPVVTNISSLRIAQEFNKIEIDGYGFNQNCHISIVSNSNKETYLLDSLIIVPDGRKIILNYDFKTIPVGSYKMQLSYFADTIYITDSLVIETIKEYSFEMKLFSRNTFRSGRWQPMFLEVKNTSNKHASMIPIKITLPKNVKFKVIGLSNLPDITINDTIYYASAIPIETKISSNGSVEIPLLITSLGPNDATRLEIQIYPENIGEVYIDCKIGNPLIDIANEYNYKLKSYQGTCTEGCLDLGKTLLLQALSQVFGINDISTCIWGVHEAFISIMYDYGFKAIRGEDFGGKTLNSWSYTNSNTWVSVKQMFNPIAKTVFSCAKALGKSIPFSKAYTIMFVAADVFDGSIDVYNCYNACKTNKDVKQKWLKDIQHLPKVVSSTTPEDKYGPIGHSTLSNTMDKQEHFIDSTQLFEYRIDYWNKEDATAPAAIVYIRDTLDTDFDISTLNFTEIGFLKWKVKLDGGSYFNVNVDCRPEMPYIVNVEGTVDPVTREVYWVHRTLDTLTMELPDDPYSGYLPPIDSSGYQIGWVDFSIKAKPGLPDGTIFSNQARVNFDGVGKWGPAPPYGPYINTWDKTEPVSRVLDLPAEVVADSVVVKWKGSDSGSGIKTYSVFVSNNNDYKKWINSSTDTMAWFKGEKGTVYTFYSIATDFVGNTETSKKNYEALTRFVSTGHTDLKSGNDSSNFEIFPNPASCCFTVRLGSTPKHNVKVGVFNSTGQQVYWSEFSGQEKEFDLSSLPKGIYTVKILSGSDVGFQKVLLQ